MRVRLALLLLCVVACEHAGVGSAGGQSPADTLANVWLQRAQTRPEVAGWLYLRAAAATADSAARSALYSRVAISPARERIPWVEAQAREHFGDTTGALRAYQALNAPVTVLRLRAALAPDDSTRSMVRRDLLALIRSASGSTAREGYVLFDRLFGNAAPAEQLTIARSAASAGAWTRARAGFDSAARALTLTDADHFALATALSRLNSDTRAVQEYARVRAPTALAAAASYQGARALLSVGNTAAATALLRKLSRESSDTSAAAALVLLADLATDDNQDANSRSLLLDVVRRFPKSRFAAPARFNAALVALITGNAKSAERELAAVPAASGEALAAAYWRGRALATLGDSTQAATVWRALIARDSTSYYSSRAAARLGTHNLGTVGGVSQYPHVPAVDSAVARIAALREFGMASEVQLENDRLYRDAGTDATRLLATGAAFAGTDQSARAIMLGNRALASVGPTPAVFRLVYPVAARDTIAAESRSAGIDPALVAALIRQESSFNPRVTSPAGARGLMQVMPSVGGAIASAAGIAPWSPALLYDPGVNIMLGIRHLAPLVRNQPNTARVLAAYNAGESRVTRWARRRGADDPEMFTERIPFLETRDYVKNVLRNREFYRALYAW